MAGWLALGSPAAALAQETGEEVLRPEGGRLNLDINAARRDARRARVYDRRCAEDVDAARISGEIVVCRQLGSTSDGGWDQQDWERRYAERTQGIKTPNVDGSGIRLPTEGSVIAITVTPIVIGAPEPPLIIDIEALPEAPPGSDADRIARGLPPRGER